MNGIERIAAERQRQIEEGWTLEHDAFEHGGGELAWAAASYALAREDFYTDEADDCPSMWPWLPRDWKPCPGDRIRELEKAGALIAAEIDRLLRLEAKPEGPKPERREG